MGSMLAYIFAFVAVLVSFAAVAVSVITARIQIKMQKQEWLPYLSHNGVAMEIHDRGIDNGELPAELYINLENVGKCVIGYESKRVCVKINPQYHYQPPITEIIEYSGTIVECGTIGINAKLYHNVGQYIIRSSLANRFKQKQTNKNDIMLGCIIDFSMQYWNISKPKDKYSLEYTVKLNVFGNGEQKQTIIKSDIKGY